jgi:hypothetical protein
MRWLLLLLWMGVTQAADMSGPQHMLELRYMDRDAGAQPYLTRILVTPSFMRMDAGEDDGDFILLDRQKHKLFNVMRGNHLAMVFTSGTLPPRPADWKPRLVTRQAAKGTQHFSLAVGGQTCIEGVAAKGASPDAARAMAELKSMLAVTQYRLWRDSPQEMQHDCDLANQVWDFGATLQLGLPLEERDFTGRTRQIESVSNPLLKSELFHVPDDIPLADAPS